MADMKDRIKQLVLESLEEIVSLRPQTFFALFFFSLISIFPLFHFLILSGSLAVCAFTFYTLWKEEKEKHEKGGEEDV